MQKITNSVLSKNKSGFSLMEVLVSLFVILVLTLGIYSLIILSLKLSADNKMYVEAIEIMNQKMEQIRNLPYSDVGVVAGSPPGLIPQVETITREGAFTVNSYVTFQDDPYDGMAGSTTPDTIPNDYKIASVKISWMTSDSAKSITSFSKIIPRTEETADGYGLLKIYVVDSNGQPVSDASVHIYNDSLATSTIDVTNPTDANGILYFIAPESFQGYRVTVTKTGYGTERTYLPDAQNLNPTKPNLSVTEGDKTEETFTIDKLATLNIHTVTDTLPDNWIVNSAINSSTNSKPRFALDSTDNIYAIWQTELSTSTTVYAQKFNSTGASIWSSDKTISNTQFQNNPDIVTTNSGISYIVWQDNSVTLKAITFNNKQPIRLVNAPEQNIIPHFYFKFDPLDNFSIFNTSPLTNDSGSLFPINQNIIWSLQDMLRVKEAKAAGAISLVSYGPGNTVFTNTTITLDKPTGVQDGDFMLAYLFKRYDNYGTISAPGGWSTLDNDISPSSNDSRGALFWKFAGASEPSDYTFTVYDFSHSYFRSAGHIRAYRGVDPADPFDGNLLMQSTAAGDVLRPAPSHTVSNDGSVLICGWGARTYTLGNGGPTFPPSMSHTMNNYLSYVTAASADEFVDVADSPTGDKNYDANQSVSRPSINWSLVLKPEDIPDTITVGSIGSQTATSAIPTNDLYIGGTFVITTDAVASHDIDHIRITEDGTVDAQNDLSNIRLNYDFDVVAPYDCAGETFNSGSDPLFGTASSSFDAANGTVDFVDSGITITNTQSLCMYVVMDVDSSAGGGETIEVSINDPSTEVTPDSGTVIPAAPVTITDTTDLLSPPEINQIHYRWRNDNDNEASASWNNFEDTSSSITSSENIRLRFEVSNSGGVSANPAQFRIEYAEKTTTCAAASGWTTLPFNDTQHWRMYDSGYLDNASSTTNFVDSLTDAASTFIAGETKDTTNDTNAITLASDSFTELEYSISPTSNANDSIYCFRLTDAGAAGSITYTTYPEVAITGDDNIYIVSLNPDGTENWAVKRINTDVTGEHQRNPRIALTENFGAATTTIVWTDNRNGNYDIYAMSLDSNGNKLWGADLQITSSSTNETSPIVGINQNDELYIGWVKDNAISQDIFLNKYDLQGNSLWGTPAAVANTGYEEYDPEIAFDSTGNPLVVWTEDVSGVKNVSLARINSSGTKIWEIQPNLTDVSFDQTEANVHADATNIYVSWTDTRNTNEDIFVQKYDFVPNALWTDDLRININTGLGAQQNSQLIINSASEPFGIWEDERDGDFNIYATKFNDPLALNDAANIPLEITGSKRIGENPVIAEYSATSTTDGSGQLSLTVEWDSVGYDIQIDTDLSSETIKFYEPDLLIDMQAEKVKNITVYID